MSEELNIAVNEAKERMFNTVPAPIDLSDRTLALEELIDIILSYEKPKRYIDFEIQRIIFGWDWMREPSTHSFGMLMNSSDADDYPMLCRDVPNYVSDLNIAINCLVPKNVEWEGGTNVEGLSWAVLRRYYVNWDYLSYLGEGYNVCLALVAARIRYELEQLTEETT